MLKNIFKRRHHARRSPSTGSTHSNLSIHSPTRSSGSSSPVMFNSSSANTHCEFFETVLKVQIVRVFVAGMSSPVSQRTTPSSHLPTAVTPAHRASAHVTNTHVTVTPPPATPTHHRANSSGGTSVSLTSPENDTNTLVTG